MGSGRKAASDLSTSDDYVLCSAFDADQGLVNTGNGTENGDSSDYKMDSISPRLTKSCIYGEIKANEDFTSPTHKTNTSPYSEQKVIDLHRTVTPKNSVGSQSVSFNNNCVKISPQNMDKIESAKRNGQCNGHTDDSANTSSEMEVVTNHKGSQISISQVSSFFSA